MNGIPWWLAVPALIAVAAGVAFGVLAAWIRRNAPVVGARWHAAVEAEKAQRRDLEEASR